MPYSAKSVNNHIMKKTYLGIDTSNYRTSVALVDEDGKIIYNHRELLEVPAGKRGLRQSEAFFQHVQRLPEAVSPAMEYRDSISGIAVSTRPRPRVGSYMPCFTAGTACARELASALDVPLKEVSHQEGHIMAVKYYSDLRDSEDPVFFHFSGGTTEAVLGDEIIGGTKDISYGQVLDRIGVRLGFSFPSGEELDRIALKEGKRTNLLKPIKIEDCFINLSGIETQASRALDEHEKDADFDRDELVRELMDRLIDSIIGMTLMISEKYSKKDFIFSGGVSSSGYLRKRIGDELPENLRYVFGAPELSGDNAVGTALLIAHDREFK